MLTFVIADLHGRRDLLDIALESISARASRGTVVLTGDYVDRGPDSAGVVARLMGGPPHGWQWVMLRGNHEDMAVECHALSDDRLSWWINNGGAATLSSYGGNIPADHLDWMRERPRIHSDAHRVYVHAGVNPNLDLSDQNEAMTQWFRYPKGADIGYRGKHVVHGHTPNPSGPEVYNHRTNLDTYAVMTGRLVVGVFDDAFSGGPIDLIEINAGKVP